MRALQAFGYRDGDTPLTGRLAVPDGTPRAAVVVFPTIANMTPAVERRAAMLADLGFVAMVADFYGQPVESFEASRPLADALRADPDAYRARLMAAIDALRAHPEAIGLPLAAIGYCMGGGACLEVARGGADIVAAISFHGLLATERPARPGAIKARILVCHGDADPMVPRGSGGVLGGNGCCRASWHFHSYSGVRHGFTDPGSDARGLPAIAFDACADRQSWAAMTSLFDELLPAQG